MKPTYVLCTLLCSAMTGCFWSNAPSTGGGTTQNPAETPLKDAGTTVTEPSKLVFVTRATFSGNLGGLEGADAKCATAATAAGIAGTFVAFLSTATVDAASRVTGEGPWNDRKGRRVFDAGAARWAGFPKEPLSVDETGGDRGFAGERYWTGSEGQGTKSKSTCSGWTSTPNGEGGTTGSKTQTDDEWLSYATQSCSEKFGIICVQND